MLLSYCSQLASRSLGLKICLFTFAILGVTASFRGYVGTDTYAYHSQFQQIASESDLEKIFLIAEPAFVVIAKCIVLIGGNSFTYIFVIGILQMLLVMYILTKLERPGLFLIFYIATFYINSHFNIIRASTASLILLVSLLGMREGGCRFHVPLWASLLFHYTSILLIAYILMYKQIKEKNYVTALVVTTILSLCAFSYFVPLMDLFTLKYALYLEEEIEVNRSIGIGLFVQLLLYMGLSAVLLFKHKTEAMFWLLSVVIIKLYTLSFPILGRVEAYFLSVLILLLTKDSFSGWKHQLIVLILVAISIMNAYGVVSGLPRADAEIKDFEHNMSPYIPYHTAIDVQ